MKMGNRNLISSESQLLKLFSSVILDSIDTAAEAKAITIGLNSTKLEVKSGTVEFLDEIYTTFHSGYSPPTNEIGKIISEALLDTITIEKDEQLQYEMLELLRRWIVPKVNVDSINNLIRILKSLPAGSHYCALEVIKTSGYKDRLTESNT